MPKVLVIRLSSFGDVVMLVPAVYSVAARYPQTKFYVLTRSAFAPLFDNLGFNISSIPVDLNGTHSGLGFFKIFKRLRGQGFTHVVDEHDVLRSKIMRNYLRLFGKKIFVIDKGRKEKKAVIRTKKTDPPLEPTIDRYMDVFEKAGFPSEMIFTNYFEFSNRDFYQLRHIIKEKKGQWIGIAPFSKHEQKNYPVEKMEKIVAELSTNGNYNIFLFGGSREERKILEEWSQKYQNVNNLSKKLSLMNELLLISYLDVVISMDSANMHLASLVQVPAISIWGATHPSLGFYGLNQDLHNVIQIEDLDCRPCSVYGNIPCVRGDLACLTRISEQSILDKVVSLLEKQQTKIKES